MPTFEIICLASSNKNSGRCIAGLKTDGSGWLRPVSEEPDGTLYPEHYILDIGREPKLFDIFEVECSVPCAECHQPENWIIRPKKWRFIASPSVELLTQILRPELDKSDRLAGFFGNASDRVNYDFLQKKPAQYSLLYIKPQCIKWEVQEYQKNKRYRAIFISNNIEYNLRITDPQWKLKMDQAQLSRGRYSSDQIIDKLNLVDFTAEGFRFTVSLGEPFTPAGHSQKYCFKLIAAVINVTKIIGFSHPINSTKN